MTVEATILPGSGRRQATVALMIATAMQAFDSTIANVALPQLQQSLGGGIDLGSWVMTSYLCASAVMATLTGWFRRRCGARQAFAGAIALFVIASLLCSIAPSPAALIQFRLAPLPDWLARQERVQRLHRKDGGVPYGIALAAAALAVYPQTQWMTAVGM